LIDELPQDIDDIQLTIGSEPWWFSTFWRKSICTVVPLWIFAFIYFSYSGFCSFEGFAARELGEIFGIRDEWWIWPEYVNHFMDVSYFLFYDHSGLFSFLFATTIVLPFACVWGEGGPITARAYLGFEQGDINYAKARWIIKTSICLFENFPQAFLILIEWFIKRETITLTQLLKLFLSLIMSVRHLAIVTGEAFASEVSMTAQKVQ